MESQSFIEYMLIQFSKYISFSDPRVVCKYELTDDEYFEVSIINALDNSAVIIFYVYEGSVDIMKIELSEDSLITYGKFEYTSDLQLFYYLIRLVYEFLAPNVATLRIADILSHFLAVDIQSLADFIIYAFRINLLPFSYVNGTFTVPSICSFRITDQRIQTISVSGVLNDDREYEDEADLFKIIVDLVAVCLNSYDNFKVVLDAVVLSLLSPEEQTADIAAKEESEEPQMENNNAPGDVPVDDIGGEDIGMSDEPGSVGLEEPPAEETLTTSLMVKYLSSPLFSRLGKRIVSSSLSDTLCFLTSKGLAVEFRLGNDKVNILSNSLGLFSQYSYQEFVNSADKILNRIQTVSDGVIRSV